MKSMFKKVMVAGIALLMSANFLSVDVFAETNSTIWYGDKVKETIEPGRGEYTFRSVYPYTDNNHAYGAYEMSHHVLERKDTGARQIPQLLMMVETKEEAYEWTPSGRYAFDNNSNYEVLYCCDIDTPYEDGFYYKRSNLEDADYYNDEAAKHIRSIVTNSYPYVSIETMKKNLLNKGFEDADKLDRAQIIAAIQSAIWYYANNYEYIYTRSFDVAGFPGYGGVMHDYASELDVFWPAKGYVTRDYKINNSNKNLANDETKLKIDAVNDRITRLTEYLKNLEGTYAEKNQIVINRVDITESTPIDKDNNIYTFKLTVELNNSGSSQLKDDIALDVYVDDVLYTTKKIEYGTEEYSLNVEAKSNQVVRAVVSGIQHLPKGVYFYEPELGRKATQSLVGVAAGDTEVYAVAEAVVSGEGYLPPAPETEEIITPEPSGDPSEKPSATPTITPEETEEVVENNDEDKKLNPKDEEEKVVIEKKKLVNEPETSKISETPETYDNNSSVEYMLIMIITFVLTIVMYVFRKRVDKR